MEQSEEEQAPTIQRRSTRQSPVRSLRRSSRRNQSDDSDTLPSRPKRNVTRKWATHEEDSYGDETEEVSTSTRRTAATHTQLVSV